MWLNLTFIGSSRDADSTNEGIVVMLRQIRSSVVRAVVIAGTVVISVGVLQSAAHAAGRAYHGQDTAWTIGAQGKTVWVQDNEADNHGVFAQYITVAGHSYQVNDPDGAGGVTGFQNSPDGAYVDILRVCENTQGCGDWVDG